MSDCFAVFCRAMLMAFCCVWCGVLRAAEPVGHWPLTVDARDAGPHALRGTAREIEFAADGATFDGRTSVIEVADAAPLRLGTGDFTIAAHVEIPEQLDDVVGDLVSKFDASKRRGFGLSIVTNPSTSLPSAVRMTRAVRPSADSS